METLLPERKCSPGFGEAAVGGDAADEVAGDVVVEAPRVAVEIRFRRLDKEKQALESIMKSFNSGEYS